MTETGKQTRKQTTKAIQQLYALFEAQIAHNKDTIMMISGLSRLMVLLVDDIYTNRDDEKAREIKARFYGLGERLGQRVNAQKEAP